MSKYRRTIVTLDDTQSKRDYMLFCVFEKLWPDMILPSPLHSHPKGKDFNDDGRFDICVHIDEINIDANVEEDPLPHVRLQNPVEMVWGDMRRDPDPGCCGFMLKKGDYDIDSVTEMLPQSQSVQQTWAWFDSQRRMFVFLGEHNIRLNRIGTFTQKHLGMNLAEHPLHIGCIYVVEYSPIKTVHIETIPMIPAVRLEIDWRFGAVREEVNVIITEKVTDKQSAPHIFSQQVKKEETFALVEMNNRPRQIDIDIKNNAGKVLYFLRSVSFISSIVIRSSPNANEPEQKTPEMLGTIGLEHYLGPAILEKEAQKKRVAMEFVYFDGDPTKKDENKKDAAGYVNRMFGKAKSWLAIADPYFSVDQFHEYIVPLTNAEMSKIVIVNCKEQLETVAHQMGKLFQELEKEIETIVSDFNANHPSCKLSVYCIQGQGRLHDRFILTEKEGWQIGSSLSEFGARACCIIKLSDSAHMELSKLINGWCCEQISNIIN